MFKAVLIVGNSISITQEIKELYNQENYLLIGDPQTGTTLDEIDEKLNNNINSNTIITIFVHGNHPKNHHEISLNMYNTINTSNLFQAIQKHSHDPLQINLQSCYSGNSINEIDYLKEDSILITNSKPNTIAITEMFNITSPPIIKQHNISNNPYVHFLELMHVYAIQHGRFLSSGDIFEINPSLEILSSRNKTKEFLEQEASRFIKFSSNKLWKGEKINLSLPKFSEKDIITFAANFLNYFCSYEKELCSQFLKKNIKNNEHIVDLISNPDYEDYRALTFLTQFIDHYEVVKLLIERGTDVNKSKSNSGATPLILTVQNGHYEITKLLIDNGANVDCKSLLTAAQNGHYEIAKLLIEKGADVDVVIDSDKNSVIQPTLTNILSPGKTSLYLAAQNGHYEIVELLIESGANVDKSIPLFAALKSNNSKIFELLIEKGADVNKVIDVNKFIQYGIIPFGLLTEIARIGHYEMAKFLIEKGADVDSMNNYRETPLYAAAEKGHYEMAKFLIEKGADVNIANKNKKTPLYKAAENGHYEMAKFLIEKGADVNKIVYYARTPLYAAAEKGHYEMVKFLIEKGADVDSVNYYGETPLFAAAQNGHGSIVKLLIDKGAGLTAINDYGETPLFAAAQNGHDNIVKFLTYDYSFNGIIKWIFGMVIDVNKATDNNRTPLFAAAQNGHDSAVKLLIERGADVNKALFIAAHEGHSEVVELLEKTINPQESVSMTNCPTKVIMDKHVVYKGSDICDEFIAAINSKEQQGDNKLIIEDFGLEDKINFSCYPNIKTIGDLNIKGIKNFLRKDEKTTELTYSQEEIIILKDIASNDLGENNFIFYNDTTDNLQMLESICSNIVDHSD